MSSTSTQGNMERVEAIVSALQAMVQQMEAAVQVLPAEALQTAVEDIRGHSLAAATELRSLHRDVNQTRLALASEQAALQTRVEAVVAREKKSDEMYELGRQLRERADITSGMLRQREEAMDGREAAISEQLQELGRRKLKLETDQAAFDQVRQDIQDKERELLGREEAIKERETTAQIREGYIGRGEAALDIREADIINRARNLGGRESNVEVRETAVTVREQRVERDERELVQHKSVIEKRETDVQVREAKILGGLEMLDTAAANATRENDDQTKKLQAQIDELRKLESETAANERLQRFMDDVESRGRSMITDIEAATKKVEAMSDPLERTTSTIQGLQSNVITNLANDLTVLSDRFKDALRLGERRSEDVGDDYSMDRTSNEGSVIPTTETSPGDKRKASQDLPASERQRRQRRTASTFGFRSGIPSSQSRERTRFSTVGSPRNETATPSRSGIDLPRESRLSRSISRIPVSSRQASTAGSSRASMSMTPVNQQQRQAAPVDRRAPQVTLTAEQQWYWDQIDIPGANDWSIDDSKVFLEFLQSKWTHNKKPSMDLIDRAAHNNGESCPTADSRGSGAKLFSRTTTNACNPCVSKNLTCWRIQYVNPATARRIYNPTYYAQVVNQGVPPKRWVIPLPYGIEGYSHTRFKTVLLLGSKAALLHWINGPRLLSSRSKAPKLLFSGIEGSPTGLKALEASPTPSLSYGLKAPLSLSYGLKAPLSLSYGLKAPLASPTDRRLSKPLLWDRRLPYRVEASSAGLKALEASSAGLKALEASPTGLKPLLWDRRLSCGIEGSQAALLRDRRLSYGIEASPAGSSAHIKDFRLDWDFEVDFMNSGYQIHAA